MNNVTVIPTSKSRPVRILIAFFGAVLIALALSAQVGAVDEIDVETVRLGTITGNGVNIREDTSVSSKIYALLSQNVNVAVIGNVGEWAHVAVDGMDGYVFGRYINILDSGDADLGYGQITATVINIRSAASTDSDVVCKLTQDSYVHILGVFNGWYKVTTESGNYSGFIHPNYLKPVAEKEEEFVPVSSSSGGGSSSGSSSGGSSQSSWGSSVAGQLMSVAERYIGVPYVWGGSSPSGFDCGGFTYYCYKKIGYTIPRTGQQNVGTKVSRSDLRVGDLVFFSNGSSTFGHVGIYAGDGMFIHAPKPGSSVRYTAMSGYYSTHFVAARRIIG